jgi:hypothetical protein
VASRASPRVDAAALGAGQRRRARRGSTPPRSARVNAAALGAGLLTPPLAGPKVSLRSLTKQLALSAGRRRDLGPSFPFAPHQSTALKGTSLARSSPDSQ